MIASPFPPWVELAIAPMETLRDAAIDPREAALIPAHAVERRRRDFVAGRTLAHRALAARGADRGPILWGPRHEPLWPEGWVGAISHAEGYACAAVAPRERTAGLGVDLEWLERKVDPEIARLVCLPEELRWVESADLDARLKAVFSAKESIFKALYPIAGVFLEFSDARLHPREGGFEGELLVAASPRHPAGFRMPIDVREVDRHVFTSLLLPP